MLATRPRKTKKHQKTPGGDVCVRTAKLRVRKEQKLKRQTFFCIFLKLWQNMKMVMSLNLTLFPESPTTEQTKPFVP